MGLPHYAVEVGPLAPRTPDCPVCCKPGRWVGERFVPESETAKGFPRCYCRSIQREGNGAYAYDPETRTFLRRD